MALAWAGGIAIIAGGVMAARQSDARRLLAYSSVSQLGYIAVGFGLANQAGLAGAYLHILNHAVMKALLFIAVGAALLRGGRPHLAALGLDRAMPLTAACTIIGALSIIGIPPAGGFFSKWYLLRGALDAGQPLLVVAVLAGSLLAVVYMYRLTEGVWIGRDAAAGAEAPPSVLASLVVLALLTVATGLASAALVDLVLLPATRGVF
jgi:multicomponent Na+:H+ antiporter subunit D